MNNTRWSPDDARTLRENMGKLTAEEIGKMIGRSSNAVKLYALRRRWSWNPAIKMNLVLEILMLRFGNPEYFKPTREFYKAINITQMRFWSLYRGEAAPTEKEYTSLKNHFNITSEHVFENRQLKLFEEQGGVNIPIPLHVTKNS